MDVRNLDADGLLAGDRREDADVGAGERVGEVVLQLGDLAHLRSRRQAQLVAGDVRAGDGADELRLDAEVSERLDQLGGDLVLGGGVGGLRLVVRTLQQLRIRHPVDETVGLGDAGRRVVEIDVGDRFGQRVGLGLGLDQLDFGGLERFGLFFGGGFIVDRPIERRRLDVGGANDGLDAGRLGRQQFLYARSGTLGLAGRRRFGAGVDRASGEECT